VRKPRVDPEDAAAFREAVRGAVPLRAPERVRGEPPGHPPVPVQSLLDVHEALAQSASGPIPWEQSMETGEELAYLRPGLGNDVLRKLRRGHWVTQDELDLHGMTRAQAHPLISESSPAARSAGCAAFASSTARDCARRTASRC